CTASDELVLSEPEALSLSFAEVSPSCFNTADGQLTAQVSGGVGNYSYSWSNAGSADQITDLGAANYCVTVTDDNGCIIEDCFDLIAPSELIVESISSDPASCFNAEDGSATVSVSGGSGDYTYLWDDDNEQISANAVFLPAGDYNVIVTDDSGCQVTAMTSVAQPDSLMVSFTVEDVFCNGGSDGEATALPVGGTSPYNFSWESGATTATATGLTAGTTEVEVTDANGCVTLATASVGEPAEAVTAIAAQDEQGCFEASANIASVVAGGGTGSGYTYSWSDPAGQATATATGLAAGEYTVTVADGNGCTATTTISLTDLEPITFNFLAEPPTCNGATDGGVGLNQINGGAGQTEDDYSFAWSTGDNTIAVPNVAGGVTYSATVTDDQGCEAVQERFLPDPEPVTFELAAEPVSCDQGDDGTASVVNLNGPNGGYTYQWSANTGSQNTAAAINLAAGNYNVTVTDEMGCFAINSIAVTSPSPIVIQAQTTNNGCYGQARGSISVTASGGIPGYTYRWSNTDTLATTDGLIAGDYTVTVTDANGCQEELTRTVKQPEELDVTATAEQVSCFGSRDGSITLAVTGGTPPFRYSLDNQTFIGSSTLIGLEAGDYTVRIRDANDCTFTVPATVTEPAEFMVDAGPNLSIMFGDSIQLQATYTNNQGAVEIVWTAPYAGTLSCTECEGPFASPQYTIDYELYGIDENGCESTDLLRVLVEKVKIVTVATGFTPNGDGANDLLMVHGLPGTIIEDFRVYDRWGELVFEQEGFEINDPNVGWDGTYRGQPLNGGVFVWSITALHTDGEEVTYRGQTTLIR
ncbi:MAG: gliding motility-associated C-terminal domain-containing protein, partial [Lewinella sp.]|nr:gliding motility-associated C-terminal domain-containing protein [Lewinella sp.]